MSYGPDWALSYARAAHRANPAEHNVIVE